ncbi:Vp1054 [Ectropis obliqua nucleopolyhedrovirus]|uniref:Putative 42.1 kDa protein n=1 Tax=Ectropis obliqua nucleopolyhedrovirus TaxID=59376 RepID=A0EYU2_9ABAC|nr:Vp1054 [Ectropis obliqua nucleopolyhedrovirus]ABI35723.1 Vp1054 [Ectropis obliqua nucleopolyhedrovirus]AGS47897.1 putative 42.1 kDa protein [Ectropis obliqua nucleopolyhedrovirus]QWV59692.1 Vp1054 [Ectropis obliqua nucleopolyhedrovirus]UYO72837.1 Vp1054 [Ectropis obliqua nucleopolyhedrovirus]
MSSTKNVVKFKQCVSEKLTVFKPLKRPPRTVCRFHPLRANCRAIKQHDDNLQNALDESESVFDEATLLVDQYLSKYFYHETIINTFYLNYKKKPYYSVLISPQDIAKRGIYMNADDLYAYVHLNQIDSDEQFFGIDENGERQMQILTMVIKSIIDCLNQCSQYVILCVDELMIDLLYSSYRIVVLPQKLYAIHYSEHVPIIENYTIFSVPTTDDCVTSQNVYRTFLVYNTVLSMILKQRNPFNEVSKNISIIFRNLGKCPQNRDRVKCCTLRYGGHPPGHVMCAPRNMLKRIFHYAKWARTPNNYKRYYELITQPVIIEQNFGENINARDTNQIQNAESNNTSHVLMDWYNFMFDFRTYFGIETTA